MSWQSALAGYYSETMTVDLGRRAAILGTAALLAVLLSAVIWGSEHSEVWLENGPVENASAGMYLFVAIVAGFAAFRARPPLRWSFLIASLLGLLFFGEETSWLQHQLGYETPAGVAELNAQSEFNVHNLNPFHASRDNDSVLENLMTSQTLFRLGFAGLFLGFPLLSRLQVAKRFFAKLRLPLAGPWLLVFVWVPIALSVLARFFLADSRDAIAETRELFYAVSIAALVWRWSRSHDRVVVSVQD